jgi:hypothetical protein
MGGGCGFCRLYCRLLIKVGLVQQLQLFPRDELAPEERRLLMSQIRGAYWFIRNLRGGRLGDAPRRNHYRKVAAIKRRLQLAGVPKREFLII